VITITGIRDHLQPEWLITITGIRTQGTIGLITVHIPARPAVSGK